MILYGALYDACRSFLFESVCFYFHLTPLYDFVLRMRSGLSMAVNFQAGHFILIRLVSRFRKLLYFIKVEKGLCIESRRGVQTISKIYI